MTEEEKKIVPPAAEGEGEGEGEGDDEAPAKEEENTAHFEPLVR